MDTFNAPDELRKNLMTKTEQRIPAAGTILSCPFQLVTDLRCRADLPQGGIHPPPKACLWSVSGRLSSLREPTWAWEEHANSAQKNPRTHGIQTQNLLAVR